MHLPVLTILSFLLLFLAISPCLWLEIKITHTTLIWTCLWILPWLILHELLHSFAYVIHGAKFKNITYGMCLEKSILYCLCKENISKTNILCSLLYPFLIIGVGTYILGILLGNVILILLSILNISGCVGDLVMFFFIMKLKNIEFSEFDNPIQFGIYTEENLENKKAFGLCFIEKKESLEKTNLKKINISVPSIWILAMLFLLFCFSLFQNRIY